MKKLLIVPMLAIIAACAPQYAPNWSLYSVGTGGRNYVGEFDTKEECLAAIANRVQVDFGNVKTFTASDEEEQGLGMVLMCVPGKKQI